MCAVKCYLKIHMLCDQCHKPSRFIYYSSNFTVLSKYLNTVWNLFCHLLFVSTHQMIVANTYPETRSVFTRAEALVDSRRSIQHDPLSRMRDVQLPQLFFSDSVISVSRTTQFSFFMIWLQYLIDMAHNTYVTHLYKTSHMSQKT